MRIEDLESMTPSDLFINLTAELYDAIRMEHRQKIDSILSCFDEDARRTLIVGTACLRAMKGGDAEYGDALRHALATTLYKELKEAKA